MKPTQENHMTLEQQTKQLIKDIRLKIIENGIVIPEDGLILEISNKDIRELFNKKRVKKSFVDKLITTMTSLGCNVNRAGTLTIELTVDEDFMSEAQNKLTLKELFDGK